MVALSHAETSRCATTGRSLLGLRKIGQKLTVDRIDSSLGYVEGNMQLLAEDLNSAKGNRFEVPQRAINWLLDRLERTVYDRLSTSGAVHRD
jgi:hypothetical protein